ncbi:hypothetical protein SAMN06295937_100793 [Sphingopyxis flava]|uniref:Uncharacterized protein n=1 Tax=Sphingopyxis flava TaxID=1507287 RepID=A0A1T5BS90_9SPHN|nr:hypothetical protein SAMN06295937_100793 [Sphingopyxis flava]
MDFQTAKRAILAAAASCGCSVVEAGSITISPGPCHGGRIALASVRGADGREILRVYTDDDVRALVASQPIAAEFAANVRRSLAAA